MARPMRGRQPCLNVLVKRDDFRIGIGKRQKVIAVQWPNDRLIAIWNNGFRHFITHKDFKVARGNSEQAQAILVGDGQLVITLQHLRGDDVVLEITDLNPNQINSDQAIARGRINLRIRFAHGRDGRFADLRNRNPKNTLAHGRLVAQICFVAGIVPHDNNFLALWHIARNRLDRHFAAFLIQNAAGYGVAGGHAVQEGVSHHGVFVA